MKRNCLLATLGESPAVVTEAIDFLEKEKKIQINSLIILTTEDTDAEEALNILAKHIPQYYGGRIVLERVEYVESYHDVDSFDSALEFMRKACATLNYLRKMTNTNVYVCIAGGRKTMTSLMTLAVQFYGAAMLFHVVSTDPKIEVESKLEHLRNLKEEDRSKRLHPPINKLRFIELPFIGLFPMLSDILEGLKRGKPSPQAATLLENNDLIKDNQPTARGKAVLEILEYVESLPDPRVEKCDIRITTKEPKEENKTREWAAKIEKNFPFITKIETIDWRNTDPTVEVKPPNFLVVYLPGKQVRGIGFRLTTTAKSLGQLERAKKEVEDWIKREKI